MGKGQAQVAISMGGHVKKVRAELISRRTWWKPWTWLRKPRQVRVIDDFQLHSIGLVDGKKNPHLPRLGETCVEFSDRMRDVIVPAGTVFELKAQESDAPSANRDVLSPGAIHKVAEEET